MQKFNQELYELQNIIWTYTGHCFETGPGNLNLPPQDINVCSVRRILRNFLIFALSPSLVLSSQCCSFPQMHFTELIGQTVPQWYCDVLFSTANGKTFMLVVVKCGQSC